MSPTADPKTPKKGRHPDLLAQPAASFDFKYILYEKYNRRAKITLNRPEVYNAFHYPMCKEFTRALDDAAWDDEIGVVIVTGAGDKAFCTGADLREQAAYFVDHPPDYWKWMAGFIEVHDKLRQFNKPTIARLNGIVVGGGNEINISCDLAVAADDIYLKQIGTAHGSVAAAGATQWLPLIVGDRRAREILFLCEEFTAQQALEWGWVNRVVPRAQLDDAVEALADKLLNKLPESMRYTKQQLNFWRDLSWGMTIGHARDWLTMHAASKETAEAVQAFIEKRSIPFEQIRKDWAKG